MNPHSYSCTNKNCTLYEQVENNQLVIHSQQENRLKCTCCNKTFSIRKGTGFYRLRYDQKIITQVMTLLAFGCPAQAIVSTFGIDYRTLDRWAERFGTTSRSLHKCLCFSIFDNVHIQADELYQKLRGKGKAWIATALDVTSRMWLGVEVKRSRNRLLIKWLLEHVKHTLAEKASVFMETDGLSSYVSQAQLVFRSKITNKGRWRWQVWQNLVVVQVVKTYSKTLAFTGLNKIKLGIGSWKQVGDFARKWKTNLINTAYVERHNATLRGQLNHLVRKSRNLKEKLEFIKGFLWFKLAVYNYATYHRSLSVDRKKKTPGMKAGVTNKKLSIKDILHFNVYTKNITYFDIHD